MRFVHTIIFPFWSKHQDQRLLASYSVGDTLDSQNATLYLSMSEGIVAHGPPEAAANKATVIQQGKHVAVVKTPNSYEPAGVQKIWFGWSVEGEGS